ncbi:MAG TPA: hypothetical protein VIY68_01690 [Steroidobacteraceae bacterium]
MIVVAVQSEDWRADIAREINRWVRPRTFDLEDAAAIEDNGRFHLIHHGCAEISRAATHAVADDAKIIGAHRRSTSEKIRGSPKI